MHCMCNTLLPYSNEFTCILCGYKELNQKNELTKLQRKKNS